MYRNFIKICSSNRCSYSIFQYSQMSTKGSAQKYYSTIDTNEVLKFGNHMKIWWDSEGPLKPLHQMNNIRVPFVRDCLNNLGMLNPTFVNTSSPLIDLNILDVGCGGGILSEPLVQLGAKVTGVDANKELIQVANIHSLQNKKLGNRLSYIHAPLEDISDEYKNHFDVVVASEIIEHVACKEMLLKSCTDVLKPGGSLFLTTFNKTLMSWLYGIIVLEDIFKVIPKGTHEWEKFVRPQEVEAILKEHNCETHLVRGLIYVGNKWTWRQSTSVTYGLHAVKNKEI